MSASTVTASTMAKFMKGLIGQGTVTDGADSPLKNPKNPPTDKLVDSDVESGGGDGANDNETRQTDDKASKDVPKKEKEGDDKNSNDKETGNATLDKGSVESPNEEATEDSKRTDDISGKEKDDEKDDGGGGGATAETTPDHSDDDEGNDEGGGEDDNDGDDEADEDNRKRSLQDPDSPGGGSASSGSDEGDESKGQKSTGTVSKRSALRAKKRLKKEDTDRSSTKNKTVTGKTEKDEGRKCKDSTPSTPKEERRKRKPDSTGDSPPHSQSDLPELPKRLRHGADSSEEKRVGESGKTQPEDSSSEGEEAEIAVAGNDSAFKTPSRVPLKPPVTNLLVDFVHSPAPKISSLVEITRGHDPITSARPSVSLHSSQEDLSGAVSAASSEGHIVEDCAKLKADQAKTLRRAKDMLKAAFSEEDSSGSEEETSAEKATIVKKDPVVRAISDSDTDMQPQVTS